MVISVSSQRSASGLRPVNLRRDTYYVLRLLELAFGDNLDRENRLTLQRDLTLSRRGWMRPALHLSGGFTPGFVWEEDGSIVGNVSVMPAETAGRFLIANVAVHPAWRRRGIAYRLMEAALDAVIRNRGRHVLLQVKHENHPAQELYYSLGFRNLGAMTQWYGEPSRLAELPASSPLNSIRPLPRNRWQEAYDLDVASFPTGLHWPDPLPTDAYRTTIGRWLQNLIVGRQVEHWMMTDDSGYIAGIATIISEWNRAHALHIRVLPRYQGQIERALLAKTLRRLPYLAYRRSRLDHPANDTIMSVLLRELNFDPKRTLVTMRMDI